MIRYGFFHSNGWLRSHIRAFRFRRRTAYLDGPWRCKAFGHFWDTHMGTGHFGEIGRYSYCRYCGVIHQPPWDVTAVQHQKEQR